MHCNQPLTQLCRGPRRRGSSPSARPARPAPAHAARLRGYTVLEVMVALAVLTVGGAGVVAMQKATLLGNNTARNLATANAIAATWAERLRTDGLQWTEVAGVNTIGNTTWLNVVGSDFPTIAGSEGQWLRPVQDAAGGVWYQANVQGLDTSVAAEAAFCTNIRLVQLLPTMIRAEIRVYWLRERGGGLASGATTLCSNNPTYLLNVGGARDRYHFVYLTTAIMRNDSSR
jgi:prepilin-type N-terminal cleavage/methylation domain-containing protein